jgi:hypothetical protein
MIQITFLGFCKLLIILDISKAQDGCMGIASHALKRVAMEWWIRKGMNILVHPTLLWVMDKEIFSSKSFYLKYRNYGIVMTHENPYIFP